MTFVVECYALGVYVWVYVCVYVKRIYYNNTKNNTDTRCKSLSRGISKKELGIVIWRGKQQYVGFFELFQGFKG